MEWQGISFFYGFAYRDCQPVGVLREKWHFGRRGYMGESQKEFPREDTRFEKALPVTGALSLYRYKKETVVWDSQHRQGLQHRENQDLHAHPVIHPARLHRFLRLHALGHGTSQGGCLEPACLGHIFSCHKGRYADLRGDGAVVISLGLQFPGLEQ